MRNKAFTLAETLIVIGIIGVVAALTLPNLNHATGDKETVTRLMKAYSMINEANDRAIATYGPVSEWSQECRDDLNNCWLKRIGEFLKVSKSCNEAGDEDEGTYSSCESLAKGNMSYDSVILQLADGMSIGSNGSCNYCDCGTWNNWNSNSEVNDLCLDEIKVDINGPTKGKNKDSYDVFHFGLSDRLGLIPRIDDGDIESDVSNCMNQSHRADECTWWVLEYGNLDYLKADEDGKCNDSNIVLDGVNNTSCH